MTHLDFVAEPFTEDERALLARHFTNVDGPVFALVDLPEVVKGALFARYSRSAKSLRRLFLDEFAGDARERDAAAGAPSERVGVGRAERLYERVLTDYGDDSVAQLGGVHLACEQSSQLLAKVLEWGRLAGYLEQSTRYVPYDDRPGGRWRYHIPAELDGSPLRASYVQTLDRAFETYATWLPRMQAHLAERSPKRDGDTDAVHRATIRAKACDALRGLLPAATRSNVGIYATAQSYEQLLLRMRAHPLAEARESADLVLAELHKLIPAFLRRVDLPERGGAWSEYLRETRDARERVTRELLEDAGDDAGGRATPFAASEDVELTDFDPEGEIKVVAAALYAVSDEPDGALLKRARAMTTSERTRVLEATVGDRANRRHRPGRAFERTSYRFDVLCDYGAFRDLQRHRMLTIEWQPLSTRHGYVVPPEIDDAGARDDWDGVMGDAAALAGNLSEATAPEVAQYAVPMAYRIRFVMQMNAREAMHLIELRTTPQGHPAYRRVAQAMHRLIDERAGHHAIAASMRFADHSAGDEGRLTAERRSEERRQALLDAQS